MKNLYYLIPLLIIASLFASCKDKDTDNEDTPSSKIVHVQKIYFEPTEVEIFIGDQLLIELDKDFFILPENADNKTVTYFSRSEEVATVSKTGLITGSALGTAKIGVRTVDMEKRAEIMIKVVDHPKITITSFDLNITSHLFDVQNGEIAPITVTPTFVPNDAEHPYFEYEVLDGEGNALPYVLEVTKDDPQNAKSFTIKPLGYGVAIVKISTADGGIADPKVVKVGVNASLDRNYGIENAINTDGYYDIFYLPVNVKIGEDGDANPIYQTWLDRNLGSPIVATAQNDRLAYGSKFQFSRKADGHEKISYDPDNNTGTILSGFTGSGEKSKSRLDAGTDKFILVSAAEFDWADDQTNKLAGLWGGTNGVTIEETYGNVAPLESELHANNPCPVGYRVPTGNDWLALYKAATGTSVPPSSSGIASPGSIEKLFDAIKIVTSGEIARNTQVLFMDGRGFYWSNIPTTGGNSVRFGFVANGALHSSNYSRSSGYAVRCIKDRALNSLEINIDN